MKRIQILDYARFAAAFAVILFHYTYNGIRNGKIDSITHIDPLIYFTRYGYLGVEFFFMISGYVIFFSAKYRDAPTFASSRCKRLFPAYWAAVIFTSLFAIFFGGDLMAVTPKMILANFTMLQNYAGIGSVDGVYWTLFYELRFYFAVLVFLILGLKQHLGKLFVVWPLAIIGSRHLGVQSDLLLMDYHYLYFAAGGLFALVSDKAKPLRITSLCVTGISCIYIGSGGFSNKPTLVIITSFFVFFVICLIPKIRNLNLPMSSQCGAITYPLYLIHAHFGYMMISLFASDLNKWFVYPSIIVVVLALSWTLHYLVEVRLASFWTGFFYRFVERPLSVFENRTKRITRRWTQRATARESP